MLSYIISFRGNNVRFFSDGMVLYKKQKYFSFNQKFVKKLEIKNNLNYFLKHLIRFSILKHIFDGFRFKINLLNTLIKFMRQV